MSCLDLDDVPVGEPVVVQELGHVVPHPVGQQHHTLLPSLRRQGRQKRIKGTIERDCSSVVLA